jgi:phosphatidate cytidylyltransferase
MLLFAVIVGLGLWEFHSFTAYRPMRLLGTFSGIYLFVASFFFAGGYVDMHIFLPYILLLLLVPVRALYLKTENPVNDWMIALLAQMYCAGFLSLLNFIAFDSATFEYSPYYVLLIFVFVWLNDTSAYLIGTIFGKHKMFPRISPQKSWEGFAGGFGVTVSASLLLAGMFPCPTTAVYHWPALAVLVVVFATWGDLVESLMKRSFGVKDSGRLLPGHGGILDRMDSIILAVPVVFIYVEYFIRN